MSQDRDSIDGASPWLFLSGLLVFLGSILLFVADLLRGLDILRSVAANTVGAVTLIGWAALDTYRNEESEVATVGGATGTALLLYGLYLLGTGVVIAVTGLFAHDRLTIGLLYLGFAVLSVVLGYAIFPTGTVMGGDDASDTNDGSGGERDE